MVAENPETPKGTPNTLWNILDEKSKKNLELILQKQKNFNLLEYLKKTVENLTRKHVNFSINIQELSHLKNLSPETQKNIIALIKEKNKDNPHIRDIESNQTLKQFLSEVYASL
ncbi:hypothetical protein IJM86_04185 [bacterium]|nr:hypothetical protein [bacterium]